MKVRMVHACCGETGTAIMSPRPGETLTEMELQRFCRERPAPCTIAEHSEFMELLPESTMGEELKKELRER